MDLITSLNVAASGLRVQSSRMRVIAENMANVSSSASTAGGDPYRRRVPSFELEVNRETGAHMARFGRVLVDRTPFQQRFSPGHPAADERGYVKMPNVNPLIEAADMREAQSGYEANLNMISAARRMLARTLDILRA